MFINLFVIDEIISSKLLVGKSVLPHAPLNNVSPENNIFSSSQYNEILPHVSQYRLQTTVGGCPFDSFYKEVA